MKDFISIMSGKTKLRCVIVIMLAVVGSAFTSFGTVMAGSLYADITSGSINGVAQGLRPVLSLGFVLIAGRGINILRRGMIDCTIPDLEVEIRMKSTEKLLTVPLSYYDGAPSGEKTAELNMAIDGYLQLIKMVCNDVFGTVLVGVFTLIQVFRSASGVIVAIMGGYVFLAMSISYMQIYSQNKIRVLIVEKKNALAGKTCQVIKNREFTRGMNSESCEVEKIGSSAEEEARIEKRHHRCMCAFDFTKDVCEVVFHVAVILTSLLMISEWKMSPGSVITVCLLFSQLVTPVKEVFHFIDDTAVSVTRARPLLRLFANVVDSIFGIKSSGRKACGTEITLSDVVITTPGNDKVIGIYDSLVVPGDSIVCLDGTNGSGKSSVVKCIKRIYPYRSGEITLFGKNLDEYTQEELANTICYIPQENVFTTGTVRENLNYGLKKKVSDEELIGVLKAVYLVGDGHKHSVICRNPREALDVRLSEDADELSGGMKQRLMIARAMLQNPMIYAADEITANLDGDAVDDVLSNLERHALEIGAGIIYISHDPKVKTRCRKIIELRNKLRTRHTEEAA